MMEATFNTLERGWIPVVAEDDKEELLGILQVIEKAHELKEISSASPLEEYSLYRFLGLFLMDALRPESEEDIEDLLDEGHFDLGRIEDYVSTCMAEGVSFDLFDEKRPFLQSVYDPKIDSEIKPVSALDCTRPSGNNHTHFEHMKTLGQSLAPDEAARLILTTYLFCTAAAQEYPSGVNASPPYFGVIKGKNLFETLVLTLLPCDSIRIVLDAPPVLWRRTEPVVPKREVGATSWLHGMLFPARRIHLVPDKNGKVIGVHLCQGEDFVNKGGWRDPYVSYYEKDGTQVPVRPKADRAIWRNMCVIVDTLGKQPMQLLKQFREHCDDGIVNLTLYGVETNQAKYLATYRHNLTFPIRLTEDEESIDLLNRCISASERLSNYLKKGMKSITAAGNTAPKQAVQQYYSECERLFWELCDQAVDSAKQKELYIEFCEKISDAALKAFDDAISCMNLRASDLAAAAVQRVELKKSINKLKKEANR